MLGREGDRLVNVARTRVGFTPASRARLMERLRPLEIAESPFANLPEARSGRWGEGLTAEKMKEWVWVRHSLIETGDAGLVDTTREGGSDLSRMPFGNSILRVADHPLGVGSRHFHGLGVIRPSGGLRTRIGVV